MSSGAWEAVADFVRQRTGLALSGDRRPALDENVRRLLSGDRNVMPDALLNRLRNEPDLLDELIDEITVGETYFFRHREQFSLIRNEILPQLLESVRGRPLRLWSAGCATGEEPYTLAIIVHEMGIADRVRILGTDLSRRALHVAKRGRYRRWSLRDTSDAVRDTYFARQGDAHALTPEVRALVEFQHLNLADAAYPNASRGVWGMDLILCRNVLIYMGGDTVAAVAKRLLDTLSREGWLLLGASDPILPERSSMRTVPTVAGLVYRGVERPGLDAAPPRASATDSPTGSEPRPSRSPAPTAPPPVEEASLAKETDPVALLQEIRSSYTLLDYERVIAGVRELLADLDYGPDPWILGVRALANLGRAAEAARMCDAAVDRHSSSAELAYLEATLLLAANRHAEAAFWARRCLYLDARFVMGHLTLGIALSRLGDRTGAQRAFRNTKVMLDRMAPDASVPASDGEPVSRLRLLADAQQQLLEGSV